MDFIIAASGIEQFLETTFGSLLVNITTTVLIGAILLFIWKSVKGGKVLWMSLGLLLSAAALVADPMLLGPLIGTVGDILGIVIGSIKEMVTSSGNTPTTAAP